MIDRISSRTNPRVKAASEIARKPSSGSFVIEGFHLVEMAKEAGLIDEIFATEDAKAEGIKVGLIRPITLWPFPSKEIAEVAKRVKGILLPELNAGQMVENVRLAVHDRVRVEQFGRMGGIIPSPDEVLNALKEKIINR